MGQPWGAQSLCPPAMWSASPHLAVEDTMPCSCSKDATSQWLQGLETGGTDLPHHEEPEETHPGEAPAHGQATLRCPPGRLQPAWELRMLPFTR